jgi:predicted N-acyltransferase
MPTLTLPFFREIGRTMGEQVLLVLRRARPRANRAAASSPPPSA